MGYQWRNGKLMSDEEIREQDELTMQLVAFALATLGLGYLGYSLGGKWLALMLGAVGAYIGWAFNLIILGFMLVAILGTVLYFGVSWFLSL